MPLASGRNEFRAPAFGLPAGTVCGCEPKNIQVIRKADAFESLEKHKENELLPGNLNRAPRPNNSPSLWDAQTKSFTSKRPQIKTSLMAFRAG